MSITIVENVIQNADIPTRCATYSRDTLTLVWEDRRHGHGKRRSDGGVEFAISLPAGTILKGGNCMILEPEQVVVQIIEAEEGVYVVRPKTSYEWAYYAYHVGNRHQQVMIGATELVFLQNPAVRSLLEQLHIPFESGSRPFTAALANVGHSH